MSVQPANSLLQIFVRSFDKDEQDKALSALLTERIPVTAIVTVAMLLSVTPSLALYVNVWVPVAAGV